MIDTEKYKPARQTMKFSHSPASFIFWLGRLICSVPINSHPDNIYLSWLSQTWSSSFCCITLVPQEWPDGTVLHHNCNEICIGEYISYPKIIHKYYQMEDSIYVMRFYYALTAYLAWNLCCTEMRSESIVFSYETLNVYGLFP